MRWTVAQLTIIFLLSLNLVAFSLQPDFVWKFDEGSGTSAIEEQQNHNGTINGTPQWIDVTGGKALQFDGTDDHVSIANHDLINTGGPWSSRTILVIFKVDDAQTTTKQLIYEEGGKTRGLNMYVQGGKLYAGGWNKKGSESNWFPGNDDWISIPIDSGEWYQATLILRNATDTVTAGKLELWLDGVLEGQTSAARLYAHASNIGIGRVRNWTVFHDGNSNSTYYFQGAIDEVRLYNDVLYAIRVEPTSLTFAKTVGVASTFSIDPPPTPNLDSEHSTGEVIIKTVANALIGSPQQSGGTVVTASSSLNQLFQQLSVSQMTSVFATQSGPLAYFYRLKVDSNLSLSSVIDNLTAHELIELAQPNYVYRQQVVPDDTNYANQWGLAKISAAAGWDYERGDSNNTVVAIVDSGIDYTHPDLADNIWQNTGETSGNSIDDDGNGYIDDVYGWDFHTTPNDNQPDGGDHGTHVAGIVGAVTNNGVGVAGVMWNCQLMAIRVLGDQGAPDAGGYTSNIALGITYAANNGADVINMSLGADTDDAVLKAAIDDAYGQGVVLVAAAGNDNATTESYPAAYSNVISVGATDSGDDRASFSNYGDWIDIVAPGVTILNTQNGGGYVNKNGTSMATPFVSGLAGLILAKNPLLTPAQVTSTIRQSADQVEWMAGDFVGRINVESALKYQGNILIYNDSTVVATISNIALDSGDTWLSPSVTTSSIPAGGSVSVGLSLVLDGMGVGTYTDELTISSSDSLPAASAVDVSLQLQNSAPTITSLTASVNPLAENQISNLTLVANDSDDHTLSFDWSVDQGQLNPTTGQSVTYTPPDVDQNTTVTVSVTASDGYGGTDTETLDISVQTVDVTTSPTLAVGFNLLALSVEANTAYSAYGLLDEISNASSVMQWQADSQNWGQAFRVAGNNLGQNFSIQLNRGYLIQIENPTSWSFVGDPITTAPTLQLKAGLNLIGLPYPTNLTASGALSDITNGQTLTRWDATTQSWQSVFKISSTVLGVDFTLNTSHGYFIQVSQDSSWTPAVSVAPSTAWPAQTSKLSRNPAPALGAVKQIRNLTVANLTATSATVAFHTDGVGRSRLRWRLKTVNPWQTEDGNQLTHIGHSHHLQLSGLEPEQTYLVQAEVADRDEQIKYSQVMTVTTTVVSPGQPKVVYGQVIDPNGQPKADELVVLTATEAQPLLAKTDTSGYWQLNLGNMKTLTGDPYTVADEVYLSLLGEDIMHRQAIEDLSIQQLTTIHYQQDTEGQLTSQMRPDRTRMGQNYPNPFNPETWIPFELAEAARVVLTIYDVRGHPVRRIDLGLLEAGRYATTETAIRWDGQSDCGEAATSGAYFYRLQAGDYSETRKMMILK